MSQTTKEIKKIGIDKLWSKKVRFQVTEVYR